MEVGLVYEHVSDDLTAFAKDGRSRALTRRGSKALGPVYTSVEGFEEALVSTFGVRSSLSERDSEKHLTNPACNVALRRREIARTHSLETKVIEAATLLLILSLNGRYPIRPLLVLLPASNGRYPNFQSGNFHVSNI